MSASELIEHPPKVGRSGPGFGLCMLVVATVYASGLTREIGRPWTGLHDWNGAFYSQLARNFLRYPMSVHHGMPLVAVGEAVPPPAERSIYPTHPAGLMWLVAGAFRLLGDSEWAARLVPILASLGTVLILMQLLERRWGAEAGVIGGLVYSVLPMNVYFGRMVNHEAVCLFFMLAAVAAWDRLVATGARQGQRIAAVATWIVAVTAGIWVDWPGALFAGLFAIVFLWSEFRKRLDRGACAICVAAVLVATAGMLSHLVYGGLEGRWGDLTAIFTSRSGATPGDVPPSAWLHTSADVTVPGFLLAIIGAIFCIREAAVRFKQSRTLPSLDGLLVLLATGGLWVFIFWRQFRIHNYWLFYLGPLVAIACARAIITIRDGVSRAVPGAARIVLVTLVSVLIGFSFRGSEDFFQVVTTPPDDVLAWREIHRMTPASARILVFPDPVLIDQWGGARFHNITPPQLAYYLDRPFDVEGDLDRVIERATEYSAYLVNVSGLGGGASGLAALGNRFPSGRIGNQLMFDLRRDSGTKNRSRPTSEPES